MEYNKVLKDEILVVDKESFERFIEANKIMGRQFIEFTSLTTKLIEQLERMDDRLQALDGLVGLINQTRGAISTNLRMIDESTTKPKTGADAPAFIHGIDLDDLKKAYEANNFVCDKDFLDKFSQKYKVSAGTIRNRLKSLGVYKGRMNF